MTTLNFDPALVPMPRYRHKWALNKKDGHGQDNLGKRTHRGVVLHRGITGGQSFEGAIDYLISPSAPGLTDGYFDRNTGELVFMNPMRVMFDAPELPTWWEDRAGWANGPYRAAYASADGKAFVEKYGSRLGGSIINQDLESFEITGNYDTPISDACKQAIAQLCANRAQRKKIPYNVWPMNPATGLTEMYGHREFCGTSYKECPGSVVWTFMNGHLVTMVRDILEKAQLTGTATAPTPPEQPPASETRPDEPAPPPAAAPGFTDTLHARLFGEAKGAKFDPNGVISKKWLEVGNETLLFPKLVDVVDEADARYYIFEGGRVIWYVKSENAVRVLGEAS